MSTKPEKKARGRRKTKIGIVTSDRMNKTIIVKTERLVKHPRYGKYVRRWTKFWAHDEDNLAKRSAHWTTGFQRRSLGGL